MNSVTCRTFAQWMTNRCKHRHAPERSPADTASAVLLICFHCPPDKRQHQGRRAHALAHPPKAKPRPCIGETSPDQRRKGKETHALTVVISVSTRYRAAALAVGIGVATVAQSTGTSATRSCARCASSCGRCRQMRLRCTTAFVAARCDGRKHGSSLHGCYRCWRPIFMLWRRLRQLLDRFKRR